MALVGAIIGLPMFFEIGLVLLVPVILLVAQRSGLPLMRIAIPALAGLSVLHGLVPPHPGPLVAIGVLKADLGLTLALGLLVAIPTVIIAGPLFARFAARWVGDARCGWTQTMGAGGAGTRRAVDLPSAGSAGRRADVDATDATDDGDTSQDRAPGHRRPSFAGHAGHRPAAGRADAGQGRRRHLARRERPARASVLDFIGTPLVALLLAVLLAMFTLGGRRRLRTRRGCRSRSTTALPPIAGILLIVAAGGGFKQVLVDTGIGDAIADAIAGSEHLAAAAGLGRRRADPARHRVGHRRHHHRGRHRGAARRHPVAPADDLAAGAGHRRRVAVLLATSTTPASGWSRSTSG